MKFDSRLCGGAVCFLLAACSRHPPPSGNISVSAAATAEAQPDGSVKVRDATRGEISSLDKIIATTAAIDRLHPPSEPPTKAVAIKPVSVSVPGVVTLTDGRRAQMDGVLCSREGVDYISRLSLKKATSIAVVPSSSRNQDPLPAELWLVDSFLHDKDPSFGLAYTSIAETALKNGWCTPERTLTNKHNDRYRALYDAFVPVSNRASRSGR